MGYVRLVLVFQHTAARRRLGDRKFCDVQQICFNTQPPEGGWPLDCIPALNNHVSTHSRPKAAGAYYGHGYRLHRVSTHSRPKAAGASWRRSGFGFGCFNTQPPEGGWIPPTPVSMVEPVSTHSRPKAAGGDRLPNVQLLNVSTHSRPKAAGYRRDSGEAQLSATFQHTAARRRLAAVKFAM